VVESVPVAARVGASRSGPRRRHRGREVRGRRWASI